MDPFIIHFYTFITQLLRSGSHDQSHDSSSTPIPSWLQLDLSRDQALVYFPSQLRKSVKSIKNHGQLESISLSSLLSVFKSFVKRTDALVHENKLLAGKARLVQSLTERNAHLEDEVWKLRKPTDTHPPKLNGDRHEVTFNLPAEDVGGDAQLRKRLTNVESRVRELTTINEQWAIESQEKASEIKVLQIQLEDAEAERAKLESKMKTYKEHAKKPSADKSPSKVKPPRSECSRRKGEGSVPNAAEDLDVKLQLQRERDEAVEENIYLKAELEEVRRQREEDQDLIEELRDRADNLKVQAQSKLPTLKELTALTSENRQLREAVEREQAEKKALMQKIRELSQHSTQLCNGIDHGNSPEDYTTNKSSVLVQPLMTDDDLACLSGGSSTGSAAAPIFFDSTPITPQKTFDRTKLSQTNEDVVKNVESCHSFETVSSVSAPKASRSPRSPPPPNQPVAEVIRGLRLSEMECERQCPTCLTVFLTLGEREFQSHVAGCRRTH